MLMTVVEQVPVNCHFFETEHAVKCRPESSVEVMKWHQIEKACSDFRSVVALRIWQTYCHCNLKGNSIHMVSNGHMEKLHTNNAISKAAK